MAEGPAFDEEGDIIRADAETNLIELFENQYVAEQRVMLQGKAWLVSAIA